MTQTFKCIELDNQYVIILLTQRRIKGKSIENN